MNPKQTRNTHARRFAAATILAVSSAALLGACGDDGGDAQSSGTTEAAETTEADTTTEGTEGGGDNAEVCSAYAEVTIGLSAEDADPAALMTQLDTLDEQAPEEIAEPLGVLIAAARQVIDSGGEDFSAFETPEFGMAQGQVDPYIYEQCEFDAKAEVAGKDYLFEGLPSEIASGRVALLFTNEGTEAHELALLRKKDGVTESFEEILQLGEEESMAKVDEAGGTFVPMNGSTSLAIADLEAGEYLAACFIPVGTTFGEGPPTEGEGPPHFVEGMQQEFTVTG